MSAISLELPRIGSDLGRYRILRRVGAGAMGTVFEALDRDRDTLVALKMLNHLSADSIYRLKNEFRSLAGISHPNLAAMHELACIDGWWFFVMEFVDGVDFVRACRLGYDSLPDTVTMTESMIESTRREVVPARAEIPEPPDPGTLEQRLRHTFPQLVAGVTALHRLGKVHRDLKPSNVLVTRSGRVVILDFGLTADRVPSADQSSEHGLSGTPLYMAPEQFLGQTASEATDWYAVGVMLYETLVGDVPNAGNPQRILAQKLFADAPSPRDAYPATPDDLDELCGRLLSREREDRPSSDELTRKFPVERAPSDVPRTESIPLEGPFVGRTTELLQLGRAFERLCAGQPTFVNVSGESGIGKSALVRTFTGELRKRRDVTVLYGRCYPNESVPYKAFDQLVDSLSRYLGRCSEAEAALLSPRDPAALTALFPVLARVPVLSQPSNRPIPKDPTERRLCGFAAFKELLSRLADRQRLVLAIDDLQWGDADSALLFRELFSDKEPVTCLLLATSRSPLPHSDFPAFSASQEDAVESGARKDIALGGLSQQETLLLGTRLGLASMKLQNALDRITLESRGNPFFVSVLARDALMGPGPGMAVSPSIDWNAASPPTLRSLTRTWIDHLPEGPAQLLRVIAVAGRPIAENIAVSVAGVENGADSLQQLAVDRYVSAARTEGRNVECYHDQIREAVIDALSDAERRTLHSALATTLEQSAAADVQQLASHFLSAGQKAKGAHYAAKAADEACQALAFLEAIDWYEKALATQVFEAEELRSLRIRLAEAYAGAGRGPTAAHWFRVAAEGAPTAQAMKLKHRAAELLLVSGHLSSGLEVLGEVLSYVHMKLPGSPRAALWSLLWARLRVRLRGYEFNEQPSHAEATEAYLKIDACWSVGLGLSLIDPTSGAGFQTRNLLLSLEQGEPRRAARALLMEAGFRAGDGTSSEKQAQRIYDAAWQLTERLRDPHLLGLAAFMAGFNHYIVGRWSAALEHFNKAESLFSDLPGAIWELNAAHRFQLNSLAYLGDIPAIAQRVPALVERARERGNLYAECSLRVRVCGLLNLANDNPQGGIQEITDAMQLWSQTGFQLQHFNELLALVSCALYEGRSEDALDQVERNWERLKGSMLLRTQALRIEWLQQRGRTYAAVLARDGKNRSVERKLQHDIEKLLGEKAAWGTAFARLLSAGRHLALRQPELAAPALSEAVQCFTNLDMPLHASICAFRLGQLQAGEGGAQMTRQAESWLQSRSVRAPARFVAQYLPEG